MSNSPTVPDGALGRLLEDGYDVVLHCGHLVVRRVPYLTWLGEGLDRHLVVKHDGRLILPVNDTDGVLTDNIGDHQIWFAGQEPTDETGVALGPMNEADLGNGLHRNYSLSFKPPSGSYASVHDKVRHYARILRDAARSVEPDVTASAGAAFQEVEDDLPFVYRDTNTTRAGLTALNDRFRGQTIAIIGLGGSGSYILDQIAKTSVDKIVLIDGDVLENHNAFRAPGAAAKQDLQKRVNKADYFAGEYSRMHTGISAHCVALTGENLTLVESATFALVAAADSPEHSSILSGLQARGIPFIDVGMGLRQTDAGLTGLMKVVSYFPGGSPIPPPQSAADADDDAYGTNIQVADLNALNAILAVIQWKKYLGFYASHEPTTETVYKLYMNEIRNGMIP